MSKCYTMSVFALIKQSQTSLYSIYVSNLADNDAQTTWEENRRLERDINDLQEQLRNLTMSLTSIYVDQHCCRPNYDWGDSDNDDD
jgi:hypothetical protein